MDAGTIVIITVVAVVALGVLGAAIGSKWRAASAGSIPSSLHVSALTFTLTLLEALLGDSSRALAEDGRFMSQGEEQLFVWLLILCVPIFIGGIGGLVKAVSSKPHPMVGQKVPDMRFTGQDNSAVALADLAGRIIVLMPSKTESICDPRYSWSMRKRLGRLRRYLTSTEVAIIIALNADAHFDAVIEGLNTLKICPAPLLVIDSDGEIEKHFGAAGGAGAIIVDAHGVVRSAPREGLFDTDAKVVASLLDGR